MMDTSETYEVTGICGYCFAEVDAIHQTNCSNCGESFKQEWPFTAEETFRFIQQGESSMKK